MKKNISRGPLGQWTFWAYFCSLLFVIGSAIFANQFFSHYRAAHFSHSEVRSKIQSALVLARASAPRQYITIIDLLREQGMHIALEDIKPIDGFNIRRGKSIAKAMHQLEDREDLDQIGIQLDNGQWMVFAVHSKTSAWITASEIITMLAVVLVILLLTYILFISYMVPIRLISRAVERLGIDLNTQRLATVGPASMRALIRSFNSMQQRVQKLLQDKSKMLAAISHDLRTPITRLQLRAEFIEDEAQYEKTLQDLADMEHMISSILSYCKDYSQVEEKSQLDVSSLVESVAEDFQAVEKPVILKEVKPRLFYYGRVSILRRAFINIVENALKYGEEAEIDLALRESGDIVLSVRDQGPGIPESELNRVFEPFYRCDRARSPRVGGSGLGLSVVKDIIADHNGRVVLVNLPEGGLLVEIILPASAE